LQDSTRLAIARLEPILAENAGNRLTYALMRGIHQQMAEMLAEVLEAPQEAAPARGATLVGSGVHTVTDDAG
jgi:hypothetical protein